jgi:DNA-directed RNA polymerase specialized sigma24 family protein
MMTRPPRKSCGSGTGGASRAWRARSWPPALEPVLTKDVAQSAFRSFFLRARGASFPRLEDRRDLWNLLVTITIRKAIKQKRKEVRQPPAIEQVDFLKNHLARAPSHEFVVALRDEIQRLLCLLDKNSQRVVGQLLEGQTNEQIAAACGVSLATIERKRKLIRETWRREMHHESERCDGQLGTLNATEANR